jgi:hypothetical protein
MAQQHKDRPLVNAQKNMHSTLTLINVGFDLDGYKVKGDIKDTTSTMTKGVWKGSRSKTGDQKKELRLLLKCTMAPQNRSADPKRVDPPDGTIMITLEKTSAPDQTVTQTVDFATDTEPT